MKCRYALRRPRVLAATQQRGAVLLFCLIALVIMLIGSVALVRSFQSSLFSAGNIGFKRDMRNQSEMAVSAALNHFRSSGALDTVADRAANRPAANYSARMLDTNAQGIPTVLTLNALPTATFTAADLASPDGSVTIRYVIDRLCSTTGDETTLGGNVCQLATNAAAPGGSVLNLQSAERSGLTSGTAAAVPQGVVYRVSIKVTGPRNTLSFFQSTLTVPSSS
jgi:type IV pilus assembly protein PilX